MKLIMFDGPKVVAEMAARIGPVTKSQALHAMEAAMREFALEQCAQCKIWCRPADLIFDGDDEGDGLCAECNQ